MDGSVTGTYRYLDILMYVGPRIWNVVYSVPDPDDVSTRKHMELWHCTSVGWYKAQDPINQLKGSQCKKYHFNDHKGRMKAASQTVSCLPQVETFKL